MAQILVRNLEDSVKTRIRERAQRHGHSTEEEVRQILRNAVREERTAPPPLGSRIARRFAASGLDDEQIPEMRGQEPRIVDFDS